MDPEYIIVERCQLKEEFGRKGVIYGIGDIKKPLEDPFVMISLDFNHALLLLKARNFRLMFNFIGGDPVNS